MKKWRDIRRHLDPEAEKRVLKMKDELLQAPKLLRDPAAEAIAEAAKLADEQKQSEN